MSMLETYQKKIDRFIEQRHLKKIVMIETTPEIDVSIQDRKHQLVINI